MPDVAAERLVVAEGVIDLPPGYRDYDLAGLESTYPRTLWPPVKAGYARWERVLRWSRGGRRLYFKIIDTDAR